MRKASCLALVAAVGLSVAACDIQAENGKFDIDFASGKAQDTWSRTYKLAESGRFELINVNGKITAEPADGAEVIVEGRRTAKGRSDDAAKDLLTKLEIREEVGDTIVRVESRPPRLSGFSSHEIEWTIKVPKGVIVDVRTTNGGVRLTNLSNEVHAKTTNGGIRGVNMIPSTIEASTVNGGVEIELGSPLDGTDSIDIEAVNGGVGIAMPSESKATITARCVNGNVRADEELNIAREEQSNDFEKRRRLNGTMNGGGAKVTMNTTNGGVRLSRVGSKTS